MMFDLKKLKISAAAIGVGAAMIASTTMADTVIRVQSVLANSSDEVRMVESFAADVAELTGGSLTIEILPAGAVVGPRDIIDAVDAGLVEGGFAWTHYWGGKHPAANLFGAPIAGAGVGLDNIAFLSWFQYGGGKELYDRLWGEMGVNVKGFMLQPVGPEALGWFPEPIASMDDFRKLRFRAPQVWLALHTMKLVSLLLLWVVETSSPPLKKVRSTRLSGAALSLTQSLDSKKY